MKFDPILPAARVQAMRSQGYWGDELLLDHLDRSIAQAPDKTAIVDFNSMQGAGRRLGVEAVRAINDFGTGGLTPDRTLLLTLDPQLGRSRSHTRGAPPDRLESQPDDFFDRIAAAYAALARSEPERVKPIDESTDPAAVLAQALTAIADLL